MALAYMTCVPMGVALLQAFNEGESYFRNAVGGLAEVNPLMAPGVALGVPTAGEQGCSCHQSTGPACARQEVSEQEAQGLFLSGFHQSSRAARRFYVIKDPLQGFDLIPLWKLVEQSTRSHCFCAWSWNPQPEGQKLEKG